MYIDISVPKLGTDVQGFESVLLEVFEKYERTEVQVVEKPLHARCGTSHSLLRYRVYTAHPSRALADAEDRLRARTNNRVIFTNPASAYPLEPIRG